MGFFESISNGVKRHFDKNAEEREIMERLQKEAQNEKIIAFEEQAKKDVKAFVVAQAKQDSARLSGLQKLRATNRSRNLQNNPQTPGTFFEKLSSYTQKNIAEREKNLAKTEEMRKVAKEERAKQLGERQTNNTPTPFNRPNQPILLRDRKSTWRK